MAEAAKHMRNKVVAGNPALTNHDEVDVAKQACKASKQACKERTTLGWIGLRNRLGRRIRIEGWNLRKLKGLGMRMRRHQFFFCPSRYVR